MAGAGESWTQSGYPLQATPQSPVQQSLETSPPEKTITSTPDQKSVNKPVSRGPVPWYRAVTDEHVSVRQTTSQHETNGNMSSFHPVDDVHTTDDSSTAVSTSQRSVSPSTNREHVPPLEDVKEIYSTIQIPSRDIDTRLHTHWASSNYPLQPPLEVSGAQNSPTSPKAESEHSPPQTPISETSEKKAEVKRTLRRTPRSRRIHRAANSQESYDSSGDKDRSSSADSVKSPPKEKSPPVSSSTARANPWKKQLYPLQVATLSPVAPDEIPASDSDTESASSSISSHQQEDEPPYSSNPSWRRQAYPLHPSIGISVKVPAAPTLSDEKSTSDPKVEDQNSISPPQHNTMVPSSANTPISPTTKTPASPSINMPAPSPPTNTEKEEQTKVTLQQPEENHKVPKQKAVWQRRQYPLQSPASKVDLRSLTPPPSPKHEPDNTDTTNTEQYQDSTQHPLNTQRFRRPSYPLQTPVQPSNIRPPLPTISTRGESRDQPRRTLTDQSQMDANAAEVIDEWRREPYPLQSPKNVPPIHRFPTPQPPMEEQKDWNMDKIHLPKNIRAVKNAEEHDTRQGRTIIICLDGTGDKFDNDNSNIVHLISALKKDDPHQVTYYQAGIGTYNKGGLSWGFSAAADMAVGSGLGLHVRDAYHFLMHSYKEGDRICIFGFSRGAYTARCLAGMIHKVGLLPPRNIQQIEFAYEFYAKDTKEGWQQSDDFKRTFCIDVNVYFLGCFDSVASVGFIPRQLPLSTTPNNKPRYFRHAMALDERRAKFKVCRHQTKHWEDIEEPKSPVHAAGSHIAHRLPNVKDQDDAPPSYSEHARYGKLHHPNITDEEYDRLTGHEAPFETDVNEVWFAGCHADVGGGAVANEERHKLAQIPLRWMIRQTFECNTGIIFKAKVLAEFGLDVHTLWPEYERLSVPSHGPSPSFLEKFDKCLPPRSVRRDKLIPINKYEKGEHFYHLKSPVDDDWTPEQVEDFYDAMSPIHDQLLEAPGWWILEVWPVEYKVPTAPGVVITRTGMNLGRYRGVDDSEPQVHWTVLHRMQHLGYKIRARTAAHTAWRAVS